MRGLYFGVGGALAVYLAVVACLVVFQRRFLFLPDTSRPDLARAGVAGVREMTVTTADGVSLLTWYMSPVAEDAHVALYLHGNAGHIGHRAYRLEPMRRLGWGVLLLEYRGYGGNSGSPSEAGLAEDARAGWDALRGMGIPATRIVVWGESLGSGVAVRLAVEREVAAVVLEAPYTSILDMARRQFWFVPVRWLLLDWFDTVGAIGGVRAPVLVLHGARDRIIPVAMGRAVFAAAREPKRLWIVQEAGHVDLVEAGAVEVAGEFVEGLELP